jgi:HK97 gp10 family phage protein
MARRSGTGTQGSTVRSHGKGYLVHGEFIYAELQGIDELLDNIKLLGGDMNEIIEDALTQGADVIRKQAAANNPRADVQMELGDVKMRGVLTGGKRLTMSIGPSKDKWRYTYIETGSRAHEVHPKNKEALKLYQAEGLITKKTVEIPSIAAKPFLRPAFDEKQNKAIEKFGEVVRKWFEQILGPG